MTKREGERGRESGGANVNGRNGGGAINAESRGRLSRDDERTRSARSAKQSLRRLRRLFNGIVLGPPAPLPIPATKSTDRAFFPRGAIGDADR